MGRWADRQIEVTPLSDGGLELESGSGSGSGLCQLWMCCSLCLRTFD